MSARDLQAGVDDDDGEAGFGVWRMDWIRGAFGLEEELTACDVKLRTGSGCCGLLAAEGAPATVCRIVIPVFTSGRIGGSCCDGDGAPSPSRGCFDS